jgi:hypothetical protein
MNTSFVRNMEKDKNVLINLIKDHEAKNNELNYKIEDLEKLKMELELKISEDRKEIERLKENEKKK